MEVIGLRESGIKRSDWLLWAKHNCPSASKICVVQGRVLVYEGNKWYYKTSIRDAERCIDRLREQGSYTPELLNDVEIFTKSCDALDKFANSVLGKLAKRYGQKGEDGYVLFLSRGKLVRELPNRGFSIKYNPHEHEVSISRLGAVKDRGSSDVSFTEKLRILQQLIDVCRHIEPNEEDKSYGH